MTNPLLPPGRKTPLVPYVSLARSVPFNHVLKVRAMEATSVERTRQPSALQGAGICTALLGGSGTLKALGALPGSTSSSEDTGPVLESVLATFAALTEVASTDLGPSFQGLGGHTMYGAAVYFTPTDYVWFAVNDVGVQPSAAGTAHRVDLVGAGPWTGIQVATAAAAVMDLVADLNVTDNGDGSVTVEGEFTSLDVIAAQDALTNYDGRGLGRTLGATQMQSGSSTNGNTTGWVQVLPSTVPAGPFRVVALEILRGNNVGTGVRMSVASGGTGDGNPEGAIVNIDRTVGDSGPATWHREWLPPDEVFYYNGGERIFIGTHGDGATSSLFGGGSVNGGLFDDGGGNTLWLTDGTSGSTTPTVSPVGAVTAAFNFGTEVRLVIQEAPYQEDGDYTVIAGAVPGVHDQDLYPPGSEIEDIFVAWGITVPTLADLQLKDTWALFQAHAPGVANQKRFEFWQLDSGSAVTFVGDTLDSLIGVTEDDQGTSWASVQTVGALDLTPGGSYRYSIKGTTSTGTVFSLDLGGFGIANVGYPLYAYQGGALEDEELEVQGPSVGGDETSLVFDPSTATASPNNANGTVIFPGNIGMISLRLGPPRPTVTAV